MYDEQAYFTLTRICKAIRKSILDKTQVERVEDWSAQKRETIIHGGIQPLGMTLPLLLRKWSIAKSIKHHSRRM